MRRRLISLWAAGFVGLPLSVVIGQTPATAAVAPQCSPAAASEAAATAMARACGGRVEIESARTEYSQVYADPEGTQTVETAVVPQRARRSDGSWGAIDTSLRRVGEAFVPVGIAADVRFSAGGDGPFATLVHEGHTFSLSWPHKLPAPLVTGDTATYSEVFPDVDLVVRATDSGFTHALVVKSPRGAADPRVRQAHYRVGGDAELSSHPDGGMVAQAGGVAVASAGEALMWDTADHPSEQQIAMSGMEPQPRKYGQVASRMSGRDLVLMPDAAMLADPAARFPLIVDPPWVVPQGQWTYATSNNTNTPTNDPVIAAGDPASSTEIRTGDDTTGRIIRSFMRFAVNGFKYKQVITSKITGRVDHSWKCTSSRPNYFYRTASIGATPRQNWPGPALQLKLGNNNLHANETSCGEANVPFEVASSTLNSDLQTFANSGADYYYIGVSTAESTSGTNESLQDRHMRYFLSDFRLNVTYNTKPNVPDTLTVDGKACVSGANRPFVKTLTPTLRAHVTDPDSDTMVVYFWWAKWNGTSFVDEPGAGAHQDSVPHNGTGLLTVTTVDGGIYTFRAQSNDSPSHSPYLSSDVTNVPGNCEWQVDISPPAVPTVTGDIYTEGCGACGSVGQTGRFTFSSSADTQSFLWGWSDPPTNPLTPGTLGGSVTLDWTPTSSGPRTLYVRAIDRAGNEANKTYQFYVAAETPALARWMMNDFPGATSLADDTGNGNVADLLNGPTLGQPGRIARGNDGLSRTALGLDGVDDRAETTGSVIADTSKSLSVAAWVKLGDLSANRSIVSIGGTNNSAFWLEYASGTGWRFTSTIADQSPGSYNPPATATSPARLNTWTHLAATYDSAAKTARIYVNGVLEGTATGVTLWDGNGKFRIGGYSAPFLGSIAEVQAWNRMISGTEVFNLVDPILHGKVGEWRMEEVGPGPAFDGSGFAHDLTFYNGAQIPPSGAGQTGTGLRLDGVDDYAAPDEPVLYTDQSFTVSAWVRVTATTSYEAFLAQESSGTDPGFVMYYDNTNNQWKIKMYASATADETTTTLAATTATTPTSYHHLVGVFDAQKLELRLYVDGALAVTRPMNAAWQPWNSTGRFLIGQAMGVMSPAYADIDEVRAYQGVVTDVTRIP